MKRPRPSNSARIKFVRKRRPVHPVAPATAGAFISGGLVFGQSAAFLIFGGRSGARTIKRNMAATSALIHALSSMGVIRGENNDVRGLQGLQRRRWKPGCQASY